MLTTTYIPQIFNADYENCPTIEGPEYFYIWMPKTKAERMLQKAAAHIDETKAYDCWENLTSIKEAQRQLNGIDTEYVLLTGNVGMSSTHVDSAFWATTENDLKTLASYENDKSTANRLSLLAELL